MIVTSIKVLSMLINYFSDPYFLICEGVLSPPEGYSLHKSGGNSWVVGKEESKVYWDPSEYATQVMLWAINEYLDGREISSSRGVARTEDGVLYLSFGRQKGHSHTAALTYRTFSEFDPLVICSPFMRNNYKRYSQIDALSVNNPYSIQGRRSSLLLLDVTSQELGDVDDLNTCIGPVSDKVVVFCSDRYGKPAYTSPVGIQSFIEMPREEFL